MDSEEHWLYYKSDLRVDADLCVFEVFINIARYDIFHNSAHISVLNPGISGLTKFI